MQLSDIRSMRLGNITSMPFHNWNQPKEKVEAHDDMILEQLRLMFNALAEAQSTQKRITYRLARLTAVRAA